MLMLGPIKQVHVRSSMANFSFAGHDLVHKLT